MQLLRRLGLPAVSLAVAVITMSSVAALVYGVILVSFGSGADRAWAALLLVAAMAGFVLATWLGTGRPPRWGGTGRRQPRHHPLWLGHPPGRRGH